MTGYRRHLRASSARLTRPNRHVRAVTLMRSSRHPVRVTLMRSPRHFASVDPAEICRRWPATTKISKLLGPRSLQGTGIQTVSLDTRTLVAVLYTVQQLQADEDGAMAENLVISWKEEELGPSTDRRDVIYFPELVAQLGEVDQSIRNALSEEMMDLDLVMEDIDDLIGDGFHHCQWYMRRRIGPNPHTPGPGFAIS